ncbi:MAG: YfbK domain-containing protein [Chitinophagaceae bacterium]
MNRFSPYLILLLLLVIFRGYGQYYIRGEVKDFKNRPLQNVKIILHSSGLTYYSGEGGAFGIITSRITDSISMYFEGFDDYHGLVNAKNYQVLIMKMLPFTENKSNLSILSMSGDIAEKRDKLHKAGDETYNTILENSFLQAREHPVTKIVLNVDKASYSNARRFINLGDRVPEDAVRIEEMLNYFHLKYEEPAMDELFRVSSNITSCPWNDRSRLLHLNVSSKKIPADHVPASNLVFLVDVSGSMDKPQRLPLLKKSLKKLVDNLREEDKVSIVVYGGVVGVMLQPTNGSEKEKIKQAIEDLYPGGTTPGEAGILQAYTLAQNSFINGGNNRVILATDGDFNIGLKSEKELEEIISKYKHSGIYLTCIGVGMGNYKDSKIQVLAKYGNGNFAYLDSEMEGEKVFLKEFYQTLYTIADNVLMNIEFNSDLVKSYRLIGFDNKKNVIADTSNQLEGGEVGPGHNLIALFEFVPQYDKNLDDDIETSSSVASITVDYRMPNNSKYLKAKFYCENKSTEFALAPSYVRLATSIAMFGSLLRGSEFIPKSQWKELLEITKKAIDTNDPVQKEYFELVEKASRIYYFKMTKSKVNRTFP